MYIYAGGKQIALKGPDANFYWTHWDHLGSTHKITRSDGNVAYRAEYDPHGQRILEWSDIGVTTLNSHKFTGHEWDWATNLEYANARMYSHNRARFMQVDRLGVTGARARYPQKLNRYAYVHNDPINFVDRNGLDEDYPDHGLIATIGSVPPSTPSPPIPGIIGDPSIGMLLGGGEGGEGGIISPQATYDPRVDFRDYAISLSNDTSKSDCLKLTLLIYKAGQVYGGNNPFEFSGRAIINGLMAGLTEFTRVDLGGRQGPSDPNYRVGVLGTDRHYGPSFRGSGFRRGFQDDSNQVRHFVAYLGAGWGVGSSLATIWVTPARRYAQQKNTRCRLRFNRNSARQPLQRRLQATGSRCLAWRMW